MKLDEWVDLPLTMPGTCETFLQQHIVQPLGLREDQLISFRSEEINETECERVTNLIARKGGLDLCVLGLGKKRSSWAERTGRKPATGLPYQST